MHPDREGQAARRGALEVAPHPKIIIHINNDMNINIHIDINMNIDIHVIINMNNNFGVGDHFQVLRVSEGT